MNTLNSYIMIHQKFRTSKSTLLPSKVNRDYQYHYESGGGGPSESLIRQLMNSSVKTSPCPAPSTLNTSITGDPGRLRILQTPSSLIVCRNP